jgi:hypothetical protein
MTVPCWQGTIAAVAPYGLFNGNRSWVVCLECGLFIVSTSRPTGVLHHLHSQTLLDASTHQRGRTATDARKCSGELLLQQQRIRLRTIFGRSALPVLVWATWAADDLRAPSPGQIARTV